MSDALLSPSVSLSMWAISGSILAWSLKKIRREEGGEDSSHQIVLMGILGAFVFAAQMINVAIPGTGSSGHLGGGLLLTLILGPYRAFVVLFTVLLLQAFLFADGGILALGCNIFNMAFIPAFIVYPLLFRTILGQTRNAKSESAMGAFQNTKRLFWACMLSGVVTCVLGASALIAETTLSGLAELSFKTFAAFMLPIHFAIGLLEGIVTYSVCNSQFKLFQKLDINTPDSIKVQSGRKRWILSLCLVTVICGSIFSWFASKNPDGLEWSLEKSYSLVNSFDLSDNSAATLEWLPSFVSKIQAKSAIFPDYGFSNGEILSKIKPHVSEKLQLSLTGLGGSILVLCLCLLIGGVFRFRLIKTASQ